MKHLKLLSLLFVAFFAAATFIACGDDDESTSGGDSGLVGAWIDESGYEILVLNANGKGYWTSPRHLEKDEDDEDAFTWSASNSILTLKYAAEDYGYSYSEEDIEKYRYILSGDKLTLSDADDKDKYSSSGGFHEVYTRINLDDLKK